MGGEGVDAVVQLAEALKAPVCSTYLHNDSFPSDHPLWMGPLGYMGSKAAMNTISKADVVLALGTRLGPFGALPQYGFDYWPKGAKVIQVDTNPRKIGLTNDIDVGILGDAKLATLAIAKELEGKTVVSASTAVERLAAAKAAREAWEEELTGLSVTPTGQDEMEPREALRELEKVMPKDAMVSTDIGNICSVSNSYLRFEKPGSFFAAMACGNCGYAFPCAMGAKVGAPDRPAIAYVGDGAWGMSLNEVLTCVRENIPAIAVVSKIMGAEGIKVTKPEEIGGALQSLISSGKPGVLEIMVSKTLADPFRRDALSKPIRHLEKYKSFV